MKIKIYWGLILMLGFKNTFAQNKNISLTVFVQVAKNDSINNASVQLMQLSDSAIISTQIFKQKGNIFSSSPFSKYLIKVSCIGFQTIYKPISVTNIPLFINIVLKHQSTNLKNVVIISNKKPLIKQEDDKTIVDAAVLANSSSNAYEVLEKVPGAIIDQDGNVYLSSMTPATIFINGREMKLSSADITSLLKSLPAGSVLKIEILRNPSAKYDAASSGGIVNIVLKKGINLGSNGSTNLAYFQGVYSTKTAGININKSAGKINSYFSYQFTNRNNFEQLNSNRFVSTDSSVVGQKSYTTYPYTNHYFGGGLDIAFTKKFNAGFDVRISNNAGTSDATNNINILKQYNSLLLNSNQSNIYNKSNSFFISNEFSSKYKIDSIGSEWTSQFNYSYFNNTNNQDYANLFFFPINPSIFGDGKNKNDKNIFSAQTDLTLKFRKKITIEAGLKATISNSNNEANYFYHTSISGSSQIIDPYQTNTFKYKENIAAAYIQVSKTILGFTLKPGLRLETTNIDGHQIVPKDTTFAIKRADVFPYVFLRHKLFTIFKTDLIASAIYRRSIKRPYYEILNPYPKYVDQYLFDVGNPKLQPQFTTNYEFNVMYKEFPVLAVGVNQTTNIISNITYQNDSTKIAYRTYDNIGKNKEIYFRLIAGIPPGGKYFFYFGTQYNYNAYDGIYQNAPLNYSHGSWLFFMNQEFKVTHTFTLNMQGFMRTKALQNFYELKTFGGMFVSANKSILNKKGNIILSVNDLLQTNHTTFSINQGNIIANGTRINDTRKLGITFRYNFGFSKPKENKDFGASVEDTKN